MGHHRAHGQVQGLPAWYLPRGRWVFSQPPWHLTLDPQFPTATCVCGRAGVKMPVHRQSAWCGTVPCQQAEAIVCVREATVCAHGSHHVSECKPPCQRAEATVSASGSHRVCGEAISKVCVLQGPHQV